MSLIPTYISVVVMRPGMPMEQPRVPELSDFLLNMDGADGFDFLANECVALYSVERNKIVEHEDILVDKDGILKETILGFCHLMELTPQVLIDSGPWLWDYIKNGSYADLEEHNMAAIYAHASDLIDARLKEGKPARNNLFSFSVSFVALWSIHMDRGNWEEPAEIDHIEFHSPGEVVPR